MDYQGAIIRPPSEANSILLQVTLGCSHNGCSFCGAYQEKRFKVKPFETIARDIDEAARLYPNHKRLFLCDGDAMILPLSKLEAILDKIQETLPQVNRVGAYLRAANLRKKTTDDLKRLREKGLKIVYMGLESGDSQVLEQVNKKIKIQEMIEAADKIRQSGIKLSITVLLGLAGNEGSQAHAKATGEVLSLMNPDYVGVLSLMLVPGTRLAEQAQHGEFELLDSEAMLYELKIMLEHCQFTGLFHANHASNYLPLKLRLPRDKPMALALIDQALSGQVSLKPEWMRAL